MRKSLLIASLALTVSLAACGKSQPEASAPASDAAGTASDAAAAAAPKAVTPGVYAVTGADGKAQGTTTINADGTYTDDDGKGHRVAGLVKIVDGKTCFDPSGPTPAECFTETAPGADGSFTATNDKGETVSVKPQAK